ncbi:hypothetical protein E8E12_008071 [Didymella heteroderae]|uniref:DUF7587 domain-containing protein n=1 Tax=Didymella heteroderae TaxID=1769908 RepID=A0A9P5C576_9PLEO|nr:hypothetical protein E8E12_008071 [Didymella heteroderae]
MSNPRLAIIDMNHPTLQEDHKMLHASEVLPWLKSYGQARWARYKGRTEYLVWAGVPRAAIIHYFSLSELQNLSRQEKTCRDILKLDEIIAGRATPTVSRNIGKQKSMLNTQTAKAMAQIARTFAMNGSNASLEHLRSFIAELINGWSINITAELDIHTCSHLASTFATTLLHSSKSVQCIMHAFNEGVKEGARLMTRYGRSSQI